MHISNKNAIRVTYKQLQFFTITFLHHIFLFSFVLEPANVIRHFLNIFIGLKYGDVLCVGLAALLCCSAPPPAPAAAAAMTAGLVLALLLVFVLSSIVRLKKLCCSA